MASPRHQVESVSEMCQPLDFKILRHHICPFAHLPRAHNQFVDVLATLASMVKLSEGDDMWQLCIEVHGVLAYCINIEECMSVEVEAD